MQNIIIECVTVKNGIHENIRLDSESEMVEFFIYNKDYTLLEARKIVLLQQYNMKTKEFEWFK
jgi:hypothetical protein